MISNNFDIFRQFLMFLNYFASKSKTKSKKFTKYFHSLSINCIKCLQFTLFHLLQIVDGNAKTDVSNRREPGQFCGESEQPQTFISETSYVKIVFHTDNFTDQVSIE